MILAKEEDLALAAVSRLLALGEEVPVAGRLPWGDAMIQDLARTLQAHAFPQIPERATRSEEARIWAELVRSAQRAQDPGRAEDLRDQALSRGMVVEIEEWTPRGVAPFLLEMEGGTLSVGGGAPPVLLVLWASWCAPCHRQLPEMEHWMQSREGVSAGVKVVAVSIDANRADAARDWKGMGLETLSWAWSPGLEKVLGVGGIPAIVLVDEQGMIRMERRGYKEGKMQELDEVLPRLLE
jgi:thiol-disulfide isomerase/thioredoxin